MFMVVDPSRQRLVNDGRAEGRILRDVPMPRDGYSILIRCPGNPDIQMDGDVGNLWGQHLQ